MEADSEKENERKWPNMGNHHQLGCRPAAVAFSYGPPICHLGQEEDWVSDGWGSELHESSKWKQHFTIINGINQGIGVLAADAVYQLSVGAVPRAVGASQSRETTGDSGAAWFGKRFAPLEQQNQKKIH